MPNASETLCLLVFVMIVIIACQLQSIQASFPVAANLSLHRHPPIRRRSTGGPRLSNGGSIRKTPNSDPITQHYILYHACSSRLVRIRGKIDARGKQDGDYIQLRATTDSFDRIRIQGVMTGGFVCFDRRRARLVVKADGADVGCYFKETMTADFFTEFQSTYNTSWYIGFNKRGSALRGSHWMMTDEEAVNQKAIKCRKFIKKSLRPEPRKIKETGEVKIKGSGKGTTKVAGESEIKGGSGVKRRKTGNAERPMKHNAERRRMKNGSGSTEYKTG